MPEVLDAINWRVFAVLVTLGAVCGVAGLPYLLAMVMASPKLPKTDKPPPIRIIVLATLAQNAVLLSIAVGVGLLLAPRVRLGTPLLDWWLAGGAPAAAGRIVGIGIAFGLATGAALVFIEALVFLARLPAELHPLMRIPLWKRLLAGVAYGGVTEELLTRLFVVSVAVWGLAFVWRAPDGAPATAAYVVAIVVAALLFGASHLPLTRALTPLTPRIVVRALLLNGLGGAVYGFLYWRHGLEAAMVSHASTHLLLQPAMGFLARRLPTVEPSSLPHPGST